MILEIVNKLGVCTLREHLLKSKRQDVLNTLSSKNIFHATFEYMMVRNTGTGELCSAPRSHECLQTSDSELESSEAFLRRNICRRQVSN